MPNTKPLSILISGAGIAGCSFVACVLRAYPSTKITLVERAPSLRLTGASVDVRNVAVDLIKWMGVEPAIRAAGTKEAGTAFVNRDGKAIATFAATGKSEVQSMTSEYEIFRGELTEILAAGVKEQVRWVFDDYVQSYQRQQGKGGEKVVVTFKKRESETFDLVVAADGLNSRLRGQVLNADPREQIHDEGVFAAYFTIKKDLLQGGKMSKWRNLPGGRVVYLRPDPHPRGQTRALFMVVVPRGKDSPMRTRLMVAMTAGTDAYRDLMAELFRDGDWLTKEVLEGMHEADDFYCSPFAQVRVPKLSEGRVVLMGDAGYATPGVGTSLAIAGGYVLAGELLRNHDDVDAAVKKYEEVMLAFAKSQQSDDSAMQMLNPQTEWGISVRNAIIGTITTFKLDQLVFSMAGLFGGIFDSKFKLPKYPWPAAKG